MSSEIETLKVPNEFGKATTCFMCVPNQHFFSRKLKHTHHCRVHCAPAGTGPMSTKKVERRDKQKRDKAAREAQKVLAS